MLPDFTFEEACPAADELGAELVAGGSDAAGWLAACGGLVVAPGAVVVPGAGSFDVPGRGVPCGALGVVDEGAGVLCGASVVVDGLDVPWGEVWGDAEPRPADQPTSGANTKPATTAMRKGN